MSIKKYIPIELKILVLNTIIHFKEINEKKKFIKVIKNKRDLKKAWILDAPHYGNLGDQAILMAESKFIKDNFSDYELVISYLNKYDKYIDDLKKYIKSNDIIFLNGGGNFGDYYKNAEKIRRNIIEKFPNNKIVLFPQTIYFSENEEGEKELLKSISVYTKHKNLMLIAREKISYNIMLEKFKQNKIILTPDIVMYLQKQNEINERRGALFCCRNDLEGILSQESKDYLYDCLQNSFESVYVIDTIGRNNFEAVESKLNEFRNSELVITDRIHGMVFAAITGTPCIALSNYNYKVIGTYEWIKHLDYIKFTDNVGEVPKLIEELKNIKTTNYSNEFTKKYYSKIINFVNS